MSTPLSLSQFAWPFEYNVADVFAIYGSETRVPVVHGIQVMK